MSFHSNFSLIWDAYHSNPFSVSISDFEKVVCNSLSFPIHLGAKQIKKYFEMTMFNIFLESKKVFEFILQAKMIVLNKRTSEISDLLSSNQKITNERELRIKNSEEFFALSFD